ncbi:unnamed protein product, partial [Rotaria sp. Silwood1]
TGKVSSVCEEKSN